MSKGGNIQGSAHLQKQNYLVAESLKRVVQNKKMALKTPIIVTTVMMK